MSQLAEASFSDWPYFQTRLLYKTQTKAVNATKKREAVERIMVIEDDLE
jgi:hypothetical protein